MLKAISRLFAPLPSVAVEQDVADRIIAANIVEKFTKNFDKWIFLNELRPKCRHSTLETAEAQSGNNAPRLVASSLDIAVTWGVEKRACDKDNCAPWYLSIDKEKASVNGIPLSPIASRFIYNSWHAVSEAQAGIKAAAALALKNMEENEKKWNLVEHLTGLRRNGLGALVPIVDVEAIPVTSVPCCSHDDCDCDDVDTAFLKPAKPKRKPRLRKTNPAHLLSPMEEFDHVHY